MKHKVRHVHYVGGGGTAMRREQCLPPIGGRCDRPRMAWAADTHSIVGGRHET
jgi:hypothetical protein